MEYSTDKAGELQRTCPEIGMRAWYLEQARLLENELGFSTSNFITIPSSVFDEVLTDSGELSVESVIKLVDEDSSLDRRATHPLLVDYYAQKLVSILPEIVERTEQLAGDTIIVRASPHDEHTFDYLSFAGVYKSYMPRKELDKEANLLVGTANVLAGRFTKYGNSYYDRHSISSERNIGVMYMQPFYDILRDTPLVHGTAYITDGHMRNEYVIEPPANQLQREPRLISKRNDEVTYSANDLGREDSINFINRMEFLLDGLHRRFKVPLDVEYLVDKQGNIFVVQIRRISEKHLSNWNNIPETARENTAHGSAIVNSVGAIEGRVVDLRSAANLGIELAQLPNSILVINHEDTGRGMHSQALLDAVRNQRQQGLNVIVDHGKERVRDHLQYALVEDPGVNFIVQTNDPAMLTKLSHDTAVRIESDGLNGNVINL